MPGMSRIGDTGVGTGFCPLPVPQTGTIISGSGLVTTEGLSQSTMTCVIVAGCQIAVGIIIGSSSTGNAGGLGISRIGDSFVGSFSGTIISGSGTAQCGG